MNLESRELKIGYLRKGLFELFEITSSLYRDRGASISLTHSLIIGTSGARKRKIFAINITSSSFNWQQSSLVCFTKSSKLMSTESPPHDDESPRGCT